MANTIFRKGHFKLIINIFSTIIGKEFFNSFALSVFSYSLKILECFIGITFRI